MNAADQVQTLAFAQILASTGTVVRNYFPGASINLSPWRDDPETRYWREDETLDLALYFPGWSPRLECRSLLIQLKVYPHLQFQHNISIASSPSRSLFDRLTIWNIHC